tara:strand:- start:437 stop:796 length:360 start_codon:yes stop_codon:yes gene_type:complete
MNEEKVINGVEGQETPHIIDLGTARRGEVNEIFLGAFGRIIKMLMGSIFGSGTAIPVKIKGTPAEIKSFTTVLGREKKYMKTAAKYGLNDPRTYKDKFKLRKKVSDFERKTGLKWPFKG